VSQVTVTLTFATLALAVAELSKLTSDNVAQLGVSATETPKAEKPKAEKPKTEAVKTEAAKTEPATDKSPGGKEYKDVQAAVQKLAAVNANEADEKNQTGRLACKAVLKELGLESFKGSPASVWDDAIAKLSAKHVELTADA
jgi:hypothetical protein